jgi:hypothetical protein
MTSPARIITGVMEASGTFEGKMYPEAAAWFRYFFEQAGRRDWIEAVKRRLGLIEHGDDVAARMAQWGQDHEQPDPRIALCAKGRELDASLTLELHDERVAEIRGHPWIQGNEIFLVQPPQELMFGPESFRATFPRPVKCPGCTATIYPGAFDPSCHWSFCTIANPAMPPIKLITCL